MGADRLLSMLWLLMAHESLSAPEIARRLEVSPRTVLRDVEALSASGVPVYCERGRTGGVRLVPGFRTRVTGLSEAEARSVFLAMSAPVADSLNWTRAMASGLRKMDAAQPAAQRGVVERLARRLVIDPAGWLSARAVPPLESWVEAALGDRRAEVVYRSGRTGIRWRDVVDVYGLLAAGGTWYVAVGRAGEARFLRIDRILEHRILALTFDRPEALDLRALWASGRTAYRELRDDPVVVTAELDPHRYAELAESAVDLTDGVVLDDGRRSVTARFGDRRHATSVLERLGPDAVVREPAWLRDHLVDRARRMLSQYM